MIVTHRVVISSVLIWNCNGQNGLKQVQTKDHQTVLEQKKPCSSVYPQNRKKSSGLANQIQIKKKVNQQNCR